MALFRASPVAWIVPRAAPDGHGICNPRGMETLAAPPEPATARPGSALTGGLPDATAPLERAFEGPVHLLVHRQARETPDAVAAVDEYGVWSYAALDRASSCLAHRLRALGVPREAPVAIWAHRSAGLPVALLGILAAGAAFAILDPSYPPARLAAAVEAMSPAALVVLRAAGPPPPAVAERFGAGATIDLPPTPEQTESEAGPWPEGPPDIAVDPDALAYLAFTSGTTGRPKGILGTHRPLPHFLRWHIAASGFTPDDRFAMLSGLAHDPLLRDVLTPLLAGASLHVPPPGAIGDPEALRAFLRERRVSVIHITPSLGRVLTHGLEGASAPGPSPSLRHVFFAGELLGPQVVERLRAVYPGVRCTNFYGATETPQAMGHFPVPDDLSGEGSVLPVGRGIPDVQLLVLTPERRLCAPGEIGEIAVRSPYLARGYLNDPELTRRRFIVNPFTGDPSDRVYLTGDLGRYRPGGVVEPAGRADGQVKIRGFRVEPEDVEACLAACSGVEQCVVAAREEPGREARLVAYVQGGIDAHAARTFVRSKLPEYMVPAEVVHVERFALTPTGKVDRKALPAPPDGPAVPGEPARAPGPGGPRTPIEAALAAIWEEALRTGPVRRDDSFFDLGGDSLVALSLLDHIERDLGKKLPVRSLITHGTVAAMAELLSGQASVDAASLLVPIRPGGTKVPVYWIPGGGGLSVMAFREVSARLGDDQPVYGVEADLDLSRAPRDLPGIAARYVREIQAFQPRGPYHLLGYSAGSWVAYEMGVQLRARGEEVALLAVFDMVVPGTLTPLQRGLVLAQRARFRLGGLARRSPAALLDGLRSASRRIADGAAQAWQRGAVRSGERPGADSDVPEGAGDVFQQVIARNLGAVRRYSHGPLPGYPGRMAVILAEDSSLSGVDERIDPRLGWRTLAREGIDVYHAPGNHLSMLVPPNVDALAAVVRRAIDASREERSERLSLGLARPRR